VNAGGVWDRSSFYANAGTYSLPPFAFTDTAGMVAGIPGILVFRSRHHSPSWNCDPGFGPSQLLPGRVQFGSTVVGIEGQIDGLKVSRAFAFTGPSLTSNGIGATFWSESLTGAGTIERNVEGSLRGCVGQARDRWLVSGTGGVAVTSLRARGTFNYNLTLGPTLVPIAGLANPTASSSSDVARRWSARPSGSAPNTPCRGTSR